MSKPNFFLLTSNNSVKRKFSNSNSNQIILTTRARIARNLTNHKFGSMNDNQEKKAILNLVKDTATQIKELSDYRFYATGKLTKIQRKLLIEKHLMSSEMSQRMQGKGILVKSDHSYQSYSKKSVSIMINEEDHLRIQCITPGLSIQQSYLEVMKIGEKLEKRLNFAFNSTLGYITACPTNLGTALRISVIAHLPGLVMSSKIVDFIKNLSQIGCSIRGYFGENSEVAGNLFQVSNQITLGKSEKDIVEEMQAICLNIIEEEEKVKQELKTNNFVNIEDSVYRSYGMLRYAKMLSYEESLEILSMLELGLDLGVIKDVKKFNFYELAGIIGSSHIILNLKKNKNISEDEVDLIRADMIREKILKGIG